MPRRTVLMIVGVAAAIALATTLWMMLRGDDPKAEIQAVIDRTVEAAENKEIGTILEAVSDDFSGHGMDRKELRRMIFALIHRSQWRRIFVTGTDIELQSDDRARVTTGAVMARGNDVKTIEQAALQTRTDTLRFDIGFKKEGGDWKVYRINYRRVAPQDLLEGVLPGR